MPKCMESDRVKEKTFKCKIIYKQAKESKLLEFDINAVSISDARGKAYDHLNGEAQAK